MEKIFVDTSAWVALFARNDKFHHESLSIFKYIQNQQWMLYTSDYVIDETITTILMRSSHKDSVIAGNALFESKIIQILYVAPDYLDVSWQLYRKYKDKEFSFTDVTSFAIMRRVELRKAFAFDEHFTQAGIELVTL